MLQQNRIRYLLAQGGSLESIVQDLTNSLRAYESILRELKAGGLDSDQEGPVNEHLRVVVTLLVMLRWDSGAQPPEDE